MEIAPLRDGRLVLSYLVNGRIGDIRLPAAKPATRGDALWRHTCFEVFATAPPHPAYYEFNFSPSTEWAAYRFEDYRDRRRVAEEIGPIAIDTQADRDCFTLRAVLDLDALGALSHRASRRIGLSAVIEDIRGELSYWALAHPPGKPDFHHAGCFAHELTAEVQP